MTSTLTIVLVAAIWWHRLSEKGGKPNPAKKNQIEQVLFGSTIETILDLVIRFI